MGAFDWLAQGGDMGSGENGTYGASMNPNFLQLLAGMGAGFGQGKSAGEAIGVPTAAMIRNMQVQKAGGKVMPNLIPTPKGQAGPDAIHKNVVETADGTTTTTKVVEPSAANLNTFGTNVPPESIPQNLTSSGGAATTSPFWKALLGY